jgi:hypothetical protein
MLLNLKRDLKEIRQELTASMGQTPPAKEFGAKLMMAMVGLHVTEAGIRKTRSLEERRREIDKFKRQRNAIKNGIRALRKSKRGNSQEPGERHKRAMP